MEPTFFDGWPSPQTTHIKCDFVFFPSALLSSAQNLGLFRSNSLGFALHLFICVFICPFFIPLQKGQATVTGVFPEMGNSLLEQVFARLNNPPLFHNSTRHLYSVNKLLWVSLTNVSVPFLGFCSSGFMSDFFSPALLSFSNSAFHSSRSRIYDRSWWVTSLRIMPSLKSI